MAVLFLHALQPWCLSLTNGLELARGDRADSVTSPLASLATVSENKSWWQDSVSDSITPEFAVSVKAALQHVISHIPQGLQ